MCLLTSDEEMEEANPIEANDSDYDPTKETKKEVKHWSVNLSIALLGLAHMLSL